MSLKTVISHLIPLPFLTNLMNTFPMLQRIQEVKFLILPSISPSFSKRVMIKHFLTDENEFISCISSLNSSKSSGPHSIPIKILQLIKKDIAQPLSQIINLSFLTGQFPSKLKTAQVIPIFMKDSPLECSNYRPISLLSNIDKIFEKLMYSRVIKFLEASH